MPQNYSLGGEYVSKEKYEKFHSIPSTKTVEEKKEVIKEKVSETPRVPEKVTEKVTEKLKKKGK